MVKIILLNGVSSARKSTLCRSLQEIAKEPFLHVQMDVFLSMMPPRYANHPDAFAFVKQSDPTAPEIAVLTGDYGALLMRGMRRSVAALAAQGLNVLIDDVMLENDIDDYKSLFQDFEFHVIKVYCDLAEANARERQRGDRDLGLARWQYPRVHQNVSYDLIVDTSKQSSAECARVIAAELDL